MMKVISLVALLSIFSASVSGGGILPGLSHGRTWLTVFNFRNSQDKCYGADFEKNTELKMRYIFQQCGYTGINNKQRRNFMEYMNYPKINFKKNSIGMLSKQPKQFYDADTVRGIKNILVDNVAFLTCVFDSLKLSVGSTGKVDASSLKSEYKTDDSIPADIKALLIDDITACEEKSLTENPMVWGKDFSAFLKRLNFFRCSEASKRYACMKSSLEESAGEFDLTGLDGMFSDLSDNAKRYIIASTYVNLDKTGLWDY